MYDPNRGGLVLRTREGLLDARIEDRAAINYFLDGGVGPERRIVPQHAPIGVIGNQAGIVRRNVEIDDAANCSAERLQYLTLLGDKDTLERIEICRMDRKEPYELLHPFVHRAIEGGELLQVFPYQRLLLGVLLQDALCYDECDIISCNTDLFESVLHTT